MKKIIFLLLIFVLNCNKNFKDSNPVSLPQDAPVKTYTVQGVVLAKSTGLGLEGVTVQIDGFASIKTNSKGEFSFSGIGSSKRFLSAEMMDYDSFNKEIIITDHDIYQEITLTWKAPKIISVKTGFSLDGFSKTNYLTAQVTDEKGDNTIASVTAGFEIKFITGGAFEGMSASLNFNTNTNLWYWGETYSSSMSRTYFKNLVVYAKDTEGNIGRYP